MQLNELSGQIPESFGFLNRIQELVMYNNSLSGSIPTTIFNLSDFRVIGLKFNQLEGTLPMDICSNLPHLESLDVSQNQLGGQIPASLSRCYEIKFLDLSFNEFTGPIPGNVGNLSKLHELYLGRNSLTGELPITVFNISSLRVLSGHSNNISGSLPEHICKQTFRLQILLLDNNILHGKLPSSLSHCSELLKISVASNNLEGDFPAEIWNISALQFLFVGINSLTRESIKLNLLKFYCPISPFSLSCFFLTGIIPSSIGNMSSLVGISLRQNNFHGNIPPEFGQLQNLKRIYIGSNKFTGEIPQSIFNISVLEAIGLADSELSGHLPTVWPTNLQVFMLYNMRMTGLIPSSIKNASQLSLVGLGDNLFSGPIPMTLGSLNQLIYLDLYNNRLTNDHSMHELGFITSLADCRQLKHLDVQQNPLNGIFPKSLGLGNLSISLKKFYADNCRLKGSIPSWLGNFSNLLQLSLASNELTGSVPQTFGTLTKLQSLNLRNNKMTGLIPQYVCKMESLFSLSLSLNQLSGSLPRCLGSLTSLRELDLCCNGFTSSIPSAFWSNKDMLILNLSFNSLTGPLSPEIGNMKRMRELNLSGNQFSGEVPSTVQQLQNLVLLSLSKNNFYGSIPESFGNLISIEHLDLSQNNLPGSIPQSWEKLEYLTYFNVSFNNLSGEIPDGGCFANLTAESFKGNGALCGASKFKVSACKAKGKLPVNKSSYLKYVLPSIILILLVASVFFIRILRCNNRGKQVPPEISSPSAFRRISYYENVHATNNFDESNLIGKGSLSSVFKGILSDGMVIAVKVFNVDIQGALKRFDAECQLLSNIRHRNLVKVISSCSNLDFKALVLDYMPNGNLEKWLYSYNYCLDVIQRLEIMADVARALEYLHRDNLFPVVHCDLKPSNILLDNDMVAHVCDFGISKLLFEDQSTAQTKTLATIGYMAPEYGSAGIISPKVDVYSYGILLMETFTRKKPTDDMFQGEQTMKKWVLDSYPDAVMHIVDANLLTEDEENINTKVSFFTSIMGLASFFTSIMGLALECTADLIEDRIDMKDVVLRLSNIKTDLQSIEKRG
ncbi:hypothetical protein ACH5RR_028548 [Cinchona calisaya]|uniref:non-specific serine/threonine protein kinase n=1 Tax=Cinchona calisaya TaxID=153742 RepID=A0ABD2YTJ7_9GENT